jgi:hypothetical protein
MREVKSVDLKNGLLVEHIFRFEWINSFCKGSSVPPARPGTIFVF